GDPPTTIVDRSVGEHRAVDSTTSIAEIRMRSEMISAFAQSGSAATTKNTVADNGGAPKLAPFCLSVVNRRPTKKLFEYQSGVCLACRAAGNLSRACEHPPKVICWYCGKREHEYRFCPARPNETQSGDKKTDEF